MRAFLPRNAPDVVALVVGVKALLLDSDHAECDVCDRIKAEKNLRNPLYIFWVFTRNSVQCFARLSYRRSVRLSGLIITVQAKIAKFLLWAATRTVVYVTKFLATV